MVCFFVFTAMTINQSYMNQEKETMQRVISAGEYLAPSIKVVEMKARRVVCQSPTGGTEKMTVNTDNGSNWI